MLEAPQPRPGSSLAKADRQLARSVIFVFVLASIVAVLGPLLSYRSDLAELQELFRSRVLRSAAGDADLLNRRLLLLQSELERMAARPEINLLDSSMRPERELLDAAHHQSTLFDSGVAIVDEHGKVVWSEPADLKAADIGESWFKRVVHTSAPVIDFVSPSRKIFIVGVPVIRDGFVTGALVGFSRPLRSTLSEGSDSSAFERFVVDTSGNFTLVNPGEEKGVGAPDEIISAIQNGGSRQTSVRLKNGTDIFAVVEPVGGTGLTLVAVGSEAQVTAPIRHRFQLQMILLITLQCGAVLLLYVFLRRTYARFLGMERRAVEQERLLALGTAASLIAHEVKNSLNGLQAATTLLSTTISDPGVGGGDIPLALNSIKGEVDRLKHLASSLLLFGRPATVQKQRTQLRALVDEVVDGLKVLPEAAEVQLSVQGPGLLQLDCDPLLVATAVHNLVRNAVEAAVAAKDLGRVRAPAVTVRVAEAGGWVRIEVDDNAGGPSPDIAARLFEPFVSGKPKGIGLGLSMTRRAVEAQNGFVEFARTSLGSRFTIRLPMISEPVTESRSAMEIGA